MKLSILIIISIFLGIVMYVISLFIKVFRVSYERLSKASYELYIKYLKKFLLDIEEDLLDKRANTEQNTVLLEAKVGKKSLADKIIILFFGKPGVDKDGEIFIIISKTDSTNIEDGYSIKLISDPLFVADSRDNFEYYEYSKKKYKRIKKLVKFINNNKDQGINLYWSVNKFEDIMYTRKQVIDMIKEN